MQTDPVCGADLDTDERTAIRKIQWRGTTYYFCSPECQAAFETNPTLYLEEWPEEWPEERGA